MKPFALYIVILSAIVMLPFTLSAQQELVHDEPYFADADRQGKFYLIPEASLWIGSYTNIAFAPQLGYHLLDRLSIGAGPHYIFYRNNDFYSPVNFSSHIWGVKAFSRLSVIRNAAELLPFYLFDELFAHFEYEQLNLENRYFNAPSFPDEGRFWVEALYVGAGITQRLGKFSSYSIMVLWNLNDQLLSLSSNPTYRVGLNIYF